MSAPRSPSMSDFTPRMRQGAPRLGGLGLAGVSASKSPDRQRSQSSLSRAIEESALTRVEPRPNNFVLDEKMMSTQRSPLDELQNWNPSGESTAENDVSYRHLRSKHSLDFSDDSASDTPVPSPFPASSVHDLLASPQAQSSSKAPEAVPQETHISDILHSGVQDSDARQAAHEAVLQASAHHNAQSSHLFESDTYPGDSSQLGTHLTANGDVDASSSPLLSAEFLLNTNTSHVDPHAPFESELPSSEKGSNPLISVFFGILVVIKDVFVFIISHLNIAAIVSTAAAVVTGLLSLLVSLVTSNAFVTTLRSSSHLPAYAVVFTVKHANSMRISEALDTYINGWLGVPGKPPVHIDQPVIIRRVKGMPGALSTGVSTRLFLDASDAVHKEKRRTESLSDLRAADDRDASLGRSETDHLPFESAPKDVLAAPDIPQAPEAPFPSSDHAGSGPTDTSWQSDQDTSGRALPASQNLANLLAAIQSGRAGITPLKSRKELLDERRGSWRDLLAAHLAALTHHNEVLQDDGAVLSPGPTTVDHDTFLSSYKPTEGSQSAENSFANSSAQSVTPPQTSPAKPKKQVASVKPNAQRAQDTSRPTGGSLLRRFLKRNNEPKQTKGFLGSKLRTQPSTTYLDEEYVDYASGRSSGVPQLSSANKPMYSVRFANAKSGLGLRSTHPAPPPISEAEEARQVAEVKRRQSLNKRPLTALKIDK